MKALVEKVAKEKDVLRSERLSDGWWEKFMRRHQDKLSLRREDATAHIRIDSTNFEVIRKYYDLLEETLMAHNLSILRGRSITWMKVVCHWTLVVLM